MIPMVNIDVGAILQASLNGTYTDLVTRATGRSVRSQIERLLERAAPGAVSVIDFSNVGLLDFSCADEIVATLMRQCHDDSPIANRYILFAGITERHLDAIEHVLERNGLALVVRFTGLGVIQLIGVVRETERQVWEAVVHEQRTDAAAVAAGTALDLTAVSDSLQSLYQKRLLMREGGEYRAPVGVVA
ncbi:MAG TPA: hypothetical protein VE967_13025 [Gemmatimonadaceae bacterium]|nr:hypothetical protein [Gemmatimonadaceae bacterium]